MPKRERELDDVLIEAITDAVFRSPLHVRDPAKAIQRFIGKLEKEGYAIVPKDDPRPREQA